MAGYKLSPAVPETCFKNEEITDRFANREDVISSGEIQDSAALEEQSGESRPEERRKALLEEKERDQPPN